MLCKYPNVFLRWGNWMPSLGRWGRDRILRKVIRLPLVIYPWGMRSGWGWWRSWFEWRFKWSALKTWNLNNVNRWEHPKRRWEEHRQRNPRGAQRKWCWRFGTEVMHPSSGHDKISKLVDCTACHWLHNAILLKEPTLGTWIWVPSMC